ncbi:preprotein translocase subunit SecG [Zavarzinia compransoris]|uniref:preprotein translocase subunit SecG n=1 Tax=Zavarzinia marina TaxID=2911065 RepID=UPI001F19F613|nr:preprotein translocase subunit SecG [Zavarzinia marina]MCF4164624.1 preprotein translocase subunit SecG [Zavarzinia marina]
MDYLLVLHLVIAVVLIGVVLIQKSEGGALGIGGGGGGGGLMSARGAANFLTRLTAILAGLFMLTSLGLTMLAGNSTPRSIVDQIEGQQAPALVPGEAPVPASEAAPAPTATGGESVPAPAASPEAVPPASAN